MDEVKCMCYGHWVLITTLVKEYAEKIIATLVINGYDVKPASISGSALVVNDAGTCCVIAIGVTRVKPHIISKTDPKCDQRVICNVVTKILEDSNMFFHSIICLEQKSAACFEAGNIKFVNEKEGPEQGPYRTTNKSNLRLIKT